MKKVPILIFFFITMAISSLQQTEAQNVKSEKQVCVEMVTSEGTIVLELYNDTPLHRDNFIKLVNEGAYNGLLFHRVIDNFMIQGGDPDSKDAKPGKILGENSMGSNIPAEFSPKCFHKRGALAAAREGDDVNPKKESSGSQFYIVQGRVWSDGELDMIEQRYVKHFTDDQRNVYRTKGGAPHLDGDYTVYGEVVEGMDVVDKIAAAKRDRFDRPLEDIKIISAKVIKK